MIEDNGRSPAIWNLFNASGCLTLDQITGYAAGRLSAQEYRAVEKHLADCEFCSEAMECLEESGDEAGLREDISALQAGIQRRKAVRRSVQSPWKVYYSMAAVLVLSVTSMFIWLNRKTPYETLFDEYFKPYPNTVSILRGESANGGLEYAMAEYEGGNYRESQKILEAWLDQNPGSGTGHFYTGIAYLSLENAREAVVHLELALQNGHPADRVDWYLALAYLKSGRIEEARILLQTLKFREGEFGIESAGLLERL